MRSSILGIRMCMESQPRWFVPANTTDCSDRTIASRILDILSTLKDGERQFLFTTGLTRSTRNRVIPFFSDQDTTRFSMARVMPT